MHNASVNGIYPVFWKIILTMIVHVASWSEDEDNCSEERQNEAEVNSETAHGDNEDIPFIQKPTSLK
jgi:hypothetical protein